MVLMTMVEETDLLFIINHIRPHSIVLFKLSKLGIYGIHRVSRGHLTYFKLKSEQLSEESRDQLADQIFYNPFLESLENISLEQFTEKFKDARVRHIWLYRHGHKLPEVIFADLKELKTFLRSHR